MVRRMFGKSYRRFGWAQVGILAIVLGCVPPAPPSPQGARYSLPLTEVRRPADVQKRWGDYTVEHPDSTYVYSDNLVKATFFPAQGSFYFVLENKSDHSLQLIWDEMAYVGPTGTSSRVSPGDTRIIDMEKAHPPSVIPSKSRLTKIAIPNDHFHQNVGLYSSNTMDDFIRPSAVRASDGMNVQLLVPIKVDEVVNEYTFIFTVKVEAMTQLVPATTR